MLFDYSGGLKFRYVQITNGQKIGLQMVRILNGFCNQEEWPFEYQLKWPTSCINHLKSRLFSSDFEWSSFKMVGAIAIALVLPFKVKPSKVEISNVSRFWMFRFHIPAVHPYFCAHINLRVNNYFNTHTFWGLYN